MAEPTYRERAWAIFDRITAEAIVDDRHTNPWTTFAGGDEKLILSYEPDFAVLASLLGVPLYLKAKTTTGVPALALDVWVAYELRRAGFEPDLVWPRAERPRVLPGAISTLLAGMNATDRKNLTAAIGRRGGRTGLADSANILGKNYVKQVDVGIADWMTGPEVLISTKRMDSSFGKNAANRIEESYGDAKNLRLRHPLAALGFLYGLRSTILKKEAEKAAWLIDLLGKMGREDDAYHATCLIMIDYADELVIPDDDASGNHGGDALVAAGLDNGGEEAEEDEGEPVEVHEVEDALAYLPTVKVLHHEVPANLQAGVFFAEMVKRVLDTTPINMHIEARSRYRSPVESTS